MGKTADLQDTADRHRSWARSLTWAKSPSATKQPKSTSDLPISEKRDNTLAQQDGGAVNALQSSTRSSTAGTHAGASSSLDDHGQVVQSDSVHLDAASAARVAGAPASQDTEAQGEKPTTVDRVASPGDASNQPKPPLLRRAKAGSIRFLNHTKNALLHSWINLLLIFVPVGMAANFAHLNAAVIFGLNAVAIIPLAGLLAHATESVATRLGDTWGALLNVSFGNAVELIIFIIALVKNEITIVQASLLGSILANLLLILGMAFAAGGLRFQEQIYNNTVTQMSAVLLSLSVMSLLLPTAFHATFSSTSKADSATLQISRGTSVILLLVYVLYLIFQLKSHAYLYRSIPQEQIDEESRPGPLADVFDTSSSSSSSSSGGSDTDTTSGSHTTAKKRIKRFIRKRRKSSASSDDMPSGTTSQISSPLVESIAKPASYFEDRASHRASLALPNILSGDEGDDDGGHGRIRAHDFGSAVGSTTQSPERMSKMKSRRRKRHRARREAAPAPQYAASGAPVPAEAFQSADITTPHVGFVGTDPPLPETPNLKKGNIALTKSLPRPGLPKLFSQNVFTASAVPQTASHTTVVTNGLRRTNSLPDRLAEHNKPARATPGNRQLPEGRHVPGRTLPPHAARGAWAARVMMDSPPISIDGNAVPAMSRTAAVVMLLITTGLVALCAESLVDAIPAMTAESNVSQAFIGLIILPIVGNAAEHVTAVAVAYRNKMDLAIGVAVGSSIQIALFVTPLVVLLGWCMGKAMTLYFNLFETVSLFVTVFVVNFLVLDGKSNYLEGVLLIAAYVIIAVAAFFYPNTGDQSALGGFGDAVVSEKEVVHAGVKLIASAFRA